MLSCVVACSNERPLQPHQLFLMSLICNVHPDSTLLEFTPPLPAPLQQQINQHRQQQQQQQHTGGLGGYGGPEVMYQYSEKPDGGPVVRGTEAPGQCHVLQHCLDAGACYQSSECLAGCCRLYMGMPLVIKCVYMYLITEQNRTWLQLVTQAGSSEHCFWSVKSSNCETPD